MNWITNGTFLITFGLGAYEFKKANDKNIKITLECIDKIRNIPAVLNAIYCSERFEIELQAKYNAVEKAIDQLDHIFNNYYRADRFQKILCCFKNFLENTRPILRPHCKEKHRLIYSNICNYFSLENTNASQHDQILTKIDEADKEIERLTRPLQSGFGDPRRELLYELINKNKKSSQQYFGEIIDILNDSIESSSKEMTIFIEGYKNGGFFKNMLFLIRYKGIYCFNQFLVFIKAKQYAPGE
jgi:tetratricopeptide (TPR) repeat protein